MNARLEASYIANRLSPLGISFRDAAALRRIEMTLHTWAEKECGTGNGCIERDERTDLPYWLNSHTMHRYRVADKERGALKRLAAIMAAHVGLIAYHQTDPRGCALYILRASDIPSGSTIDSVYNRGVAVCV